MAQQSPSIVVPLPGGTQLSSPTPPNLGSASAKPSPPLAGRNGATASRASLLRPRAVPQTRRHPMIQLFVPLSLSLPSPAMGCAASTDRVERRRRGRALGHSEASTAGLLVARHQNGQQESVSVSVAAPAGRRRGCKVAPEPKEEEQAAALAMPGSPSFRFYCQKAAAVDALVAAADTDGGDSDSNGSVRITETPQAIKKNDLAHNTSDLSKSKDVNRWLKFRGLAIVAAAVYSLFSRHSAPPAAAKSHHPCAASAPLAAAAISHP